MAPEPNLMVTFPAGGKAGCGVVPISLIVPWVWATVGTRARRVEVGLGKPRAAELGW